MGFQHGTKIGREGDGAPPPSMPDTKRMKSKVALIGESSVGKTSLIRRFVRDEYDDKYLHTVGTKVSKVEITVPFGAATEVEVDLAIFDIMGQSGFKDMVKESFFYGCQGLLAVCDLTRADTLEAVHDWMSTATGVAGHVPAILMVNKMDLVKSRAFLDDQIERVARTWEMPVAFTSAKTGVGVDEAFHSLAISIVDVAMQGMEARKGEGDLRHKILLMVARKGTLGMSKKEFFENIQGISYNDLEKELTRLEREALIQINWRGPADFTVLITPLGSRATSGAQGASD